MYICQLCGFLLLLFLPFCIFCKRKEDILKIRNEISPLAAAGPRPLEASQSYNTLHSPIA